MLLLALLYTGVFAEEASIMIGTANSSEQFNDIFSAAAAFDDDYSYGYLSDFNDNANGVKEWRIKLT